jgi:hypothetical protein
VEANLLQGSKLLYLILKWNEIRWCVLNTVQCWWLEMRWLDIRVWLDMKPRSRQFFLFFTPLTGYNNLAIFRMPIIWNEFVKPRTNYVTFYLLIKAMAIIIRSWLSMTHINTVTLVWDMHFGLPCRKCNYAITVGS